MSERTIAVGPPEGPPPTTPTTHTFDTLAGHPMRQLATIALSLADRPMNTYQLGSALDVARDDPAAAELGRNETTRLRTMCNSMSYLLDRVGHGYEIRKGKANTALAVAGVLLDWELTYPNYSSALIFGDNDSGQDEGMPTTTLRAYGQMLASPTGASLPAIYAQSHRSQTTIRRMAKTLRDRQIIEPAELPYTSCEVTIDKPSRPSRTTDADLSSKIYNACSQLRAKGLNVATIGDILELIPDASQITPDQIKRAIGQQNQAPYIQYVGASPKGRMPSRLRYMPTSSARDPVADIALRMARLQYGPFHVAARERAKEIFRTPTDISYLFDKSLVQTRPRDLDRLSAEIPPAVRARRLIGSLTLHRLDIEPGWKDRSVCLDAYDIFDQTDTEEDSFQRDAAVDKAKSICEQCPVRGSCLQQALDSANASSILGGMTPEERHAYAIKPRVKP